MIKRYERFAPRLSALGYDTTPLNGKVPLLKGWQDRPEGAKDFQAHSNANIGIVLGGAHNTIAVDIDVRNEMASGLIRGLAIDILGAAPERIGNAPKTMLIYQSAVATKKVKTAVYDVDGMDACVEILAEGQQFVASGVHPDTQKDYDWPGDTLLDYKPNDLPTITTDDMAEFLAAANTVLGNYGEIKAKSLSSPSQGNGKYDFATSPQQAEYKRISDAINYVENGDMHYDDWAYMAHAIKGALGDSVPALDLFHRFSEKSTKYDATETDRMWKSIGTVNKIGAGTIFHQATQNGYSMAEENFGPRNLSGLTNTIEPDDFEDMPEDATEAAAPPVTRDAVLSDLFSMASVHGPLPPRQWVLDQWLPYMSVMLFFGSGGIGKTLLLQMLANCVALGQPFLGMETKQMPVLGVHCEDDKLELSRRQLDINKEMGVDEFGDGPDNAWLWPRNGKDNTIVTFPSQGEGQAGRFFEELCKAIEFVKGDHDSILIILDTAADLFGGNENIRREVNSFLKTYLGSLVLKYNATIVLLAHPSLTGLQGGKNATGMSGSTAWENGVRSRAYLSRDENNKKLLCLSRKKSNYSAIGEESDIQLIWEDGVLKLPAKSINADVADDTIVRHEIETMVSAAWKDETPIEKKGPCGYAAVYASQFQGKDIGRMSVIFNKMRTEKLIIEVRFNNKQVYRMKGW